MHPTWLAIATLLISASSALAGEPQRDLANSTYRVETTPDGAVNVAISFDRTGYGVISPGRLIPASGQLPAFRIETLGDNRGTTVVVAARLKQSLSTAVDEWQITAALAAPTVSSDSNLSFYCPGNSIDSPTITFIYYDNERRGRPIRKAAAGFLLDRATGTLTIQTVKPGSCKATEEPL